MNHYDPEYCRYTGLLTRWKNLFDFKPLTQFDDPTTGPATDRVHIGDKPDIKTTPPPPSPGTLAREIRDYLRASEIVDTPSVTALFESNLAHRDMLREVASRLTGMTAPPNRNVVQEYEAIVSDLRDKLYNARMGSKPHEHPVTALAKTVLQKERDLAVNQTRDLRKEVLALKGKLAKKLLVEPKDINSFTVYSTHAAERILLDIGIDPESVSYLVDAAREASNNPGPPFVRYRVSILHGIQHIDLDCLCHDGSKQTFCAHYGLVEDV